MSMAQHGEENLQQFNIHFRKNWERGILRPLAQRLVGHWDGSGRDVVLLLHGIYMHYHGVLYKYVWSFTAYACIVMVCSINMYRVTWYIHALLCVRYKYKYVQLLGVIKKD